MQQQNLEGAEVKLAIVENNFETPAMDKSADSTNRDDIPSETGKSSLQPDAEKVPPLSLLRTSIIFATLTGVITITSMTTGLLAIGLPAMAIDLDLPNHLLLWPVSVYGLTSGCSLMIAGSVADVVGSQIVYLCGCLLISCFILACALAQTGAQLIVFRGFQGIAASCCLPTTVSILSENFPTGRRRNIGFALLGAGQPLGYSMGMFLGGFFIDSLSWRFGWYLCAGIAFAVLIASAFALPYNRSRKPLSLKRFMHEIDWVGAFVASASLGMLSYVLADISESSSQIRDAKNIVLLCIAVILVPIFIFWMNHRIKQQKPPLIPNSLWKKVEFSTICLVVFLTWAAIQTVEYYSSLFFQKVQGLSAIQTSLRFLPNILIGIILSIVTGMVLHKYSAYWIVLAVSVISAASPVLLATADPQWSYWYSLFWAMLLSPLAGDVLFVISNLIITNVFPETTQALAGAVFNTVSQFGTAVGVAIMAIISSTVTESSAFQDKNSPEALLKGYRASFWACFGANALCCVLCVSGLRNIGKIGLKKD